MGHYAFMAELIIGLTIGLEFWRHERLLRKTTEDYRKQALKDIDFWKKMYEKEKNDGNNE